MVTPENWRRDDRELTPFDSGTGHRDRFGLFVGYASTSGNVRGFALAEENVAAGKLDFDALRRAAELKAASKLYMPRIDDAGTDKPILSTIETIEALSGP